VTKKQISLSVFNTTVRAIEILVGAYFFGLICIAVSPRNRRR